MLLIFLTIFNSLINWSLLVLIHELFWTSSVVFDNSYFPSPWRSFIKRQISGTSNDSKWQRMTTSGTTDHNKWQRVITSDNEWQRMSTSATTTENEWKQVKYSDFRFQNETKDQSDC